jgi:hypothetical protein
LRGGGDRPGVPPILALAMRSRRVEILYFDGCPNHARAQALVERVADELVFEVQLDQVEVHDADAAVALRFLGSPTIRVDGHDVEPGADARTEYVFACRVYRTEGRVRGEPDEQWIRDALVGAAP